MMCAYLIKIIDNLKSTFTHVQCKSQRQNVNSNYKLFEKCIRYFLRLNDRLQNVIIDKNEKCV